MSFEDRHLVFGGARPGTPWGSLGLITTRALAPLGYEVRVEADASRGRSPGLLSRGRLHLAATSANMTCWAYRGIHMYAREGAYPRLRVIATIMSPNWLGIAIRKELGITDLSQIKDRKPALRVSAMGSWGLACERILEYHGVTRDQIEAWGGRYLGEVVRVPGDPHGGLPGGKTEVDLIMGAVNAAYTFESAPLLEATMSIDLEFLPLPDDLIREICDGYGGRPGFIPYRLCAEWTEIPLQSPRPGSSSTRVTTCRRISPTCSRRRTTTSVTSSGRR